MKLRASLVGVAMSVWAAVFQGAVVAQTLEVETFTEVLAFDVFLPGEVPPTGGVSFDFQSFPFAVSFTPGAVSFQGTPVDFSGTEAEWLATGVFGTVNIDPSGAGTFNGEIFGAVSGQVTGDVQFPLGANFGPNSYDILAGSPFASSMTIHAWSSAIIPELNGENVTIKSAGDVLAVEP